MCAENITVLHFETVIYHLGTCNLEQVRNRGLGGYFPHLSEYLIDFLVPSLLMSSRLFNQVSPSFEEFLLGRAHNCIRKAVILPLNRCSFYPELYFSDTSPNFSGLG